MLGALRRLKKKLDAVDIEILNILANNCRIEVSTLAKIVGLSIPAVRKRLRRLEASGILGGCGANIDAVGLGAIVVAMIFYTERPEAIADLLRDHQSVERLYYSSGRSTGIAILKVPSIDSVERMAEAVRGKGVSRVDIVFLDKVLFERAWRPPKDLGRGIVYRCKFCGAPIVGAPYTVEVGGEILVFTNKKCADAYFTLQAREHQ